MADTELKKAIDMIMQERHLNQELVHNMIEDSIKAAYKKKFSTDENCYVEIADDNSRVDVYIKKKVVPNDEFYDRLMEITLSDAKKIDENAEVDDEILEEVDIKNFDRISVINGKQKFKQNSREVQKNKLYNEFKSKEKEIIVGYVQTIDARSGDCYVDLGNGNTGILPKGFQSPLENYKKDDKIYCYVEEVKVRDRGVDIILSRTSGQLVKKFLEINIPEIADNTIQIYKIVRKAGYKSKVAVFSQSKNIDPVGICVGLKGSRIQNIVRELNGEKIDIVEYDELIEQFIANALTPAIIKMVRVVDYDARKAYAVCDDKELSFAIGKDGLNVQLANKLTDWLVEIKSEKQYSELDLDSDSKMEADELFLDGSESNADNEKDEFNSSSDAISSDDEELLFESLPFPDEIKKKIFAKNIFSVQEFADKGIEDVMGYFEFTSDEFDEFMNILGEYVELVDET